jgi:glucosamine-6-phosphate deaminase
MSKIKHVKPGVEETQRFEKLHTVILNDSIQASCAIAEEVAGLIREKQSQGKHCVLGLATGSSPTRVYGELVKMHKLEGLSFKNVFTFNLDEYYPMQPDALQSYVRFMNEYLFDHVDIPRAKVHIPDGSLSRDAVFEFCKNYEEKIQALGGIDLQILGIGRTGHIGFNEPGSGKNSQTRMITLDHITLIDAASDFFDESNVPRKAITMGVGTILRAKRIILLAWSEGKSYVIRENVEGNISESIPATYLQEHPNTTIVLDEAAAAEFTRVKTPWLVESCEFNNFMVRKAVLWLCQKINKPILKLTDRDYNDNGLSDLIAIQGSAYDLNIRIFNEMQRTITGWPGGKPHADDSLRPERAKPARKHVVIFSPHPDDDVISMGGTFIRLHDQGHDVHVAYQTSGNIAVFDDDVIRFADFVNGYSDAFGLGVETAGQLLNKLVKQIKEKKPGAVDSPEVQRIKGLIRRGEAKAACHYIGIPSENIYFLDMPFYETGLVKKKPLSTEDVEIVASMLNQIKPHQVFAAGDLSDPHGTHRVCMDAIFRALNQLKSEPWLSDCWVWLYRGAWAEWEVENIEMAVPLSPDELLKKRRAIFKHQSQKDRPLFPGADSREFWQRAEDRNRGTAKLYNELGMPEYEAIEAFKRYRGHE